MDIELKKWEFVYADDLEKYLNDCEISKNMREELPYPFMHTDARYYIEQRVFNNEEKQMCRAIIANGHAVGGIDIFIGDDIYSKSGEIFIWVAKPYQNKGIAQQAVKAAVKLAFENYKIVRIFAKPYVHDIACENLLKNSGFQLEGIMRKAIYKDEKIYDYNMFAIIKE